MANDRVHAQTLQYSSMQQPFVSFPDTVEIFYYYPAVEGLDPYFMKVKVEQCIVYIATCKTEQSIAFTEYSQYLMYIGPCIAVINEEEPTRCYLVFYYTYDRLNMFRAPLYLSSGAHGYISDYHTDRLILRLLIVGV
jgi:hypothetical protein